MPKIVLILFTSFIWINVSAQEDTLHMPLNVLDTIVAKTNKIIVEEDTLPVYSMSVGKIGGIFPCGTRFGISLQAPGYHIFSSESAYNATYVPNSEDIQWPDEGANKNSQIYKNTFNRIKAMKVGTIEGNFGKRWTISAEQFQTNYSNLFDFELDGQQRLAGDYGNMFFEMLISIQQLAKENEDLKTRLSAIEAKLDIPDISDTNVTVRILKSQVKISPNPSDNGLLNIEYSISNKVNNASLYIFDINGKFLYEMPLIDRGIGNISKLFDLSPGVYFYQLVSDGDKGETEKLIIN